MRVLARDGVALHFEMTRGPAGAPAIVFSNSLGTDLRIWDEVVARLAGSFTLITYDKRGHGLSDAPAGAYALEDHVGDLAGLIAHLGLGPSTICGLSVGGLIAQGLFRARPDLVRALILSNTLDRIGTVDMWNERIAAVRDPGLEAMADGVIARWFTPAFRAADPALAAWRNMLARCPADGYAGTCAMLRDTDLTGFSAQIDVPVLCLTGSEDVATTPELVSAFAARIPGARFATVAAAGHIPCVEKPEQMAQKIQSFVTGLDAEVGT